VLNIHYDAYPEDITWTWAKLPDYSQMSTSEEHWKMKSKRLDSEPNELAFYYQDIDPKSLLLENH
jgi:hypothetical protein